MARHSTKAQRLHELAGAPPKMATVDDLTAGGALRDGRAHAIQTTQAKGKRDQAKINLKAVAEALIDEGLDPAIEIARVLKGRPLVDSNGNPVLDPVTGHEVMEHAIDPEVRLRTLNSLLEFTQPKLKAVEVKMSGHLELTNEQLDQRLQALLAKVSSS